MNTNISHNLVKYFKYIFYCLLDIIYYEEKKCIICGNKSNNFLCSTCYNKITRCYTKNSINIQDNVIEVYSSMYYSDIVRSIVLKLKYNRNFRCGDILSKFMVETINFYGIEYDVLTYVPMTKKALKKRGYNQSRYLAKKVGEKQGKRVMSLLVKTRDTNDQIGLSNKQRYNNLKGSFGANNITQSIKNKRILLIDDVYTSGATTYYCALELIKKGVRNITILTAAKGII